MRSICKYLGEVFGRLPGDKHQTSMYDEVFISADKSEGHLKYWQGLPAGYVRIPFYAKDIKYIYDLMFSEENK